MAEMRALAPWVLAMNRIRHRGSRGCLFGCARVGSLPDSPCTRLELRETRPVGEDLDDRKMGSCPGAGVAPLPGCRPTARSDAAVEKTIAGPGRQPGGAGPAGGSRPARSRTEEGTASRGEGVGQRQSSEDSRNDQRGWRGLTVGKHREGRSAECRARGGGKKRAKERRCGRGAEGGAGKRTRSSESAPEERHHRSRHRVANVSAGSANVLWQSELRVRYGRGRQAEGGTGRYRREETGSG